MPDTFGFSEPIWKAWPMKRPYCHAWKFRGDSIHLPAIDKVLLGEVDRKPTQKGERVSYHEGGHVMKQLNRVRILNHHTPGGAWDLCQGTSEWSVSVYSTGTGNKLWLRWLEHIRRIDLGDRSTGPATFQSGLADWPEIVQSGLSSLGVVNIDEAGWHTLWGVPAIITEMEEATAIHCPPTASIKGHIAH